MKQNKIQIPEGYKNSSLGIIPNDWEVKRLGEVCLVNQGLQIPIDKRLTKYVNGSYKYITIQYLNNNKSKEFILNPQASVVCTEDDILMTRTGNTGIVVSNVSGVFHNNFFKIDYNKSLFYKDYLISFLNLKQTQHILLVKAGTSTIPDLNHKDFYSIFISIPPLPQQQKIAEILGTWDEAIEKQSKLIDKLSDRKRGLMQQLLTGKKRLAGFSEEWKEYMIKNIASEVSNKNKNERESLVLSCTKYNGLVPSLEYFGRRIYADDISTYKIVPLNHFAYATNHIEEGSIGYQSDYEYAVLSPMYTVFKTTRIVNDSYLFSLLKTNNYILEYKKRMEGSIDRRGGLRWSEFSKIKIKLPSLPEQTAIANILTAADKEIELAKSKLELLRSQKSGLMQELLTGKTRVRI